MNTETKQLTRSKSNRMIAGVCAGLGEYMGIDPTVVRLLFVLAFFVLAFFAPAFFMPVFFRPAFFLLNATMLLL